MEPAHIFSPLRRSKVGTFCDGSQNQRPPQNNNNDEEERRQARRRTFVNSANETASTVEKSETLKKCLEIFHENKMSRDNAWSLSVIDTVSTLLDRHHKSLNNFILAGSSLEASSKVYGLRVDSVHTDVLRMSAELNARKFRGNIGNDDDDLEGGAYPNRSAGTGVDPTPREEAARKLKPEKSRKAGATITKNKETINARLDTVPLKDPIFGKLNSIVGSVNASKSLMNNVLHTVNAELRLRLSHKFWDAEILDENCDYTIQVPFDTTTESELLPCEPLYRFERFERQLLRPVCSGYIISDTPEENIYDKNIKEATIHKGFRPSVYGGCDGGVDVFSGVADSSMIFDMNADCDPVPELNAYAPVMAVDEQDFADYTSEELNAIGHCRALHKTPVIIKDMRPVDSNSNLEYSYRPLDKISQFWAGPSHWKYRPARHRSGILGATCNSFQRAETFGRTLNAKNRRQNALQSKKRLKVQFTAPIHDELFIMLDKKYKPRKTKFQTKWNQRKLRLPTDLRLNAGELLNRRYFYPALSAERIEKDAEDDDDTNTLSLQVENEYFDAGNVCGEDVLGNATTENISNANDGLSFADSDAADAGLNDAILEIATDFEGAPPQVTKIVVPFAKRAKVIDMNSLKRSCSQLITQQLRECKLTDEEMPKHPIQKNESYAKGVASFNEVYERLPELLTPAMAEGLTTSTALYAVLHLATDCNYRLIPQDDLEDFKIRQLE